ncbi:hypothetical protein EV401DRAFT_2085463 [Pisolithus croceorrhizus]|nr:hypothetical protein EV401DRAFT_2085463 [Pisolithus croceorrhizus]
MPPPKVEPPHKLAFATTNVWNTTFATEGGKFYNEIATHFWQPHLTRISKRDHEARVATCVAEIESLPKKEVKVLKVDDEDRVLLAEYHPYERHLFVFRMSHHAWLEARGCVSYLIADKRRRQARIRIKLQHHH